MGKLLTGIFIGAFSGAVAYELLKDSKVLKKAVESFKEGVKSAKNAFREGYDTAAADRAENA